MSLPQLFRAPLKHPADPSRGWILFVTFLLFLLPGTIQRGPWKMEDATHFGVVWRALASGDWTYFHLTQATLAEPPLYYWLAATTGSLLQPALSAPAAIRFATILFVAVAAISLFSAARRFYGDRIPGAAPLALMGCLGLLVASHDVQPMTATLAALSVMLLGMSRLETPLRGGLLIAIGVAGVLLGSGLRLAPALFLIFAAGLLSRQRGATATMAIGLAGGSAGFAVWWMLLHAQSPDAALQWFSHQLNLLNPGSGTVRQLWDELVTLSWFAWPAWPLALYAMWARRHRLTEDAYRIPLAMSGAILLVLATSGEIRQAWYVILLPPLALLSVPGLEALRRGGESLLDWFGRMTFGLFLIVLLLGWSAMTFGWPEKWAAKSARWAPGYVAQIDALPLLLAGLVILAWLWICFRSPRSPQKSLFVWSGGLATFWVVIVMLWLPWFDHQRSFRSVADELAGHLPANGCVIARDLGEAQFAAFGYYLRQPMFRRAPSSSDCRFALVQGSPTIEIAPEGNWKRLWEASRPGDRNERYRLYLKL